MANSFFILLLLLTVLCGLCHSLNLKPIIGIVSESSSYTPGHSVIVASYVKYIESAGGRVVPIINNITQAEVKTLFGSINGVLFPGGGVSLSSSDYFEVAKYIFELAKQANDDGHYFPLWGTCLGFQLLCVLQSGTTDILSHFDSENYPAPLNFTDAASSSRLFSMFTDEQLNWIKTESITFNNHQGGVAPETFMKTSSLNQFYRLLSTNVDRKKNEFVSSIEAYKYPFYGVQFHPEKNVFEWNTIENIPHSYHAISIAQTLASFFVQEARKSDQCFSSQTDETDTLIYNYSPTYSGKNGSAYEQKYLL